MANDDTDLAKVDDGGPAYSYRAALLGAPWELWLRPEGVAWRVGSASGFVPYQKIRRVRLSYRPATLQQHRFLTEIWADGAPRLKIFSASWRNLTEVGRQDAEYRTFVTEMHRRLHAVGSKAIFSAGTPLPIFALGVIVFAGATVAFAGVMLRTLQSREWTAAAIVGGLFLMLGWQLGNYFLRNRPQTYRADAVPEQVLPRA